MKKKIQKPFDVELAKKGAKVETKDGDSVRILCYDRIKTDYPIVALINFDNEEACISYNIKGSLNCNQTSKDLVIIDEIKYKFDEGDYIVGEVGFVYKITKIDDMYHTIQVSSGYRQRWTIEDVENNFHKWTIQDAHAGDILIDIQSETPFIFKDCSDEEHPNYPVAYCGIDVSNIFKIPEGNHWWTNNSIRPANKEEKELLFNKLEEAGYKWNSDTLTLSKVEKWRDKEGTKMNGYYISSDATIYSYDDGVLCKNSYNVFATKKQAKSALAMARISQIMANDNRFGGIITDEEWNTDNKYIIIRRGDNLGIETRYCYEYLAFHTKEQAELFLNENEDLIKMYYMLD